MNIKKIISLLNKMMLRTIKQNLFQFIAIIVIGAIAVTLFVGLEANALVFEAQVNEVYEKGNLADLWVTTKSYDNADLDMIKSFLSDSDEIESRLYMPIESKTHSIFLTVVDKLPNVSKPFGNIIENDNNTENDFIYVDNDLMTSSNSYSTLYELGGDFSFALEIPKEAKEKAKILDSFLKDGKENILTKDFLSLSTTVDGTMDHPENITKASYNYSVCLISDARLKRMFKEKLEDTYKDSVIDLVYSTVLEYLGFNKDINSRMTNPNQYVIKINSKTNIDELKDKINNYFNNKEENNLYMLSKRDGMPFYMTISSDVKQARSFTYVFPFVFFLVGVLVILTTISQMVLKDRIEIGTLKAIGVPKALIMLHYILLTGTLVLIGTVIGEVIGPIILPKILGMKYGIIYHLPKAKYKFPILEGILTLVFFLGISTLVTYIIARGEISLKPIESMRPKVISFKNRKRKNILKKTKFFSLKMALRNISTNLGKSIMVIVGVLGCTSLLVCGFGIEDSISYGVNNDLSLFYSSDLTVVLSNYKTKEELDKDILDKDNLEYYEYAIHQSSEAYKNNDKKTETTIYLIPDDTKAVKVNFDKNGCMVSEKVAKELKIKVGDTIHFTFNSKYYETEVLEIYSALYYNGIIVHQGNEIFKDSEEFLYTIIEIELNDESMVNSMVEYYQGLNYVSEARTPKHWKKMTNNLMSGISVMTNAIKVFAILLGIVVIYNLTLMNYKERTRDIATLKVLGFNHREILRSLLIESLSLTLIGVLIGLALGYPFMLLVMENNIVSLVYYLYHIYFKSYVIAFLLTFGVAFVINILLSLGIRKIKMVESLKSVE